MIYRIASALIPFMFSMGAGYFAGRVKRGAMPLPFINSMLVDYAMPCALFLSTASMKRASVAQHGVLIAVLVGVMLMPYFASLRFALRVQVGSSHRGREGRDDRHAEFRVSGFAATACRVRP